MVVPDHVPEKRVLAKVRVSNGENRYVGVQSIDF